MGVIGLLLSDFTLSVMWVWSGILLKMLVFNYLQFNKHDIIGEIVKLGFSLFNLFFFAFLLKFSNGGAYNPLNLLASGLFGGFHRFLLTFGARIPVQVLGAIYGVRLLIQTFPEIGLGPKLNSTIHHGALTEGLLTFMIVFISLSLTRTVPGNFVTKTWISSLAKLTLNIIGADITGGCMNPASVTGWAYARGDHITKEHIWVYWVGPVIGTLSAAWIFEQLFQKPKEKTDRKPKSE